MHPPLPPETPPDPQDPIPFHYLVDTLPHPISFIDRNYRYRIVNRAYARLFLLSEAEIIGRSVGALCGDALFEREIRPRMDRCFKGEAVHYEMQTPFPGTDARWMEMRYFPYRDPEGRVTGLVSQGLDITDRKEAQRLLQAEHAREVQEKNHLRAIFDATPIGMMLVDAMGNVKRINPALAAIRGAVPEGKKLRPGDVLHCLYAVQGCRNHAACSECRIRAVLDTVLETGTTVSGVESMQTLLVGDKLENFFFIMSGAPLPIDGRPNVLITLADITGRIRAEEKAGYLAAILEHSDTIAVLKDTELRYLHANQAYLDLTGHPDTQTLAGKTDAMLFQGIATPEEILSYMENDRRALRLQKGEQVCEEETLLEPSGGIRTFLTKKFPVYGRDPATCTGVATLSTEITRRKTMENALRHAKTAAETANIAKNTFLATMSHEIRTPMNGILGMAELLGLTPLTGEQQDYVAIIRESCQGLLAIINDILDFARIEAGRMHLEPEDFSLSAFLDSLLLLVRTQAEKKGLLLFCDKDPDIPDRIRLDRRKLKQILENLANNAIKFTPSGRILLSISMGRNEAGEERLHFRMQDTGIGIPEAKRPLLFRPFSQVDGSVTRKYGGTGLGLSICRELVTLMGGHIGIGDKAPPGATFWFTLPFERAAAEGHGAESRPLPAALLDTDQKQGRILVAEDNPTNQAVILGMLKKLDLEAQMVNNGRELLEKLHENAWDLILMDLEMPEMGGLEATRIIRRERPLLPVPIIAMTAHATGEDRERCREAGMSAYLAKPLDMASLTAALAAWLPRKKALP